MTYSTVLFDFDLTLFDTDGAEAPAFNSTVAQLGIERVAARYDAYRDINQALWDAVHAGDLTPGEVHVPRFEQWVAHVGSGDLTGGHRYGIDTCWYNPAGLPNHTDVAPTHETRALDELIDVVGGVPQP